MSLVSSYESPYVYKVDIPRTPTLAGFNFTVTDAYTGLPIQNARCNIHAALNGTGDADGGYTDANGIFGIDAQWFVPRSWSVYKEGYVRQISNNMTTQIPVALEPTTIIYTVNILAGTGGSTTPSGFIDVEPNTELTVTAYPIAGYVFDYWVYKGANAGSINPVAFLIDRDAITIAAVFKVVEEPPPPPPPPPPPNGDIWPIVKPEQVFDNERISPGLLKEGQKQREKEVDISVVLGGRIEYSVKLESSIITGCTYYIIWNNEILDTKGFFAWEPYGTIKSGIVDIPLSKIRSINILTIALSQVPATYNVCLFNVFVTLGYSSEPTVDPPWKTDGVDWITKYGKWIALGVAGLVILYMLKRPSIIVVGGQK